MGKLRFGGHTACLAARIGQDDVLVLDAGSGLRSLGNDEAQRRGGRATRYHVFFSHYHLDHIEGLPHFLPLYHPENTVRFHGFQSEGRSVRDILQSYMAPPYFPVSLASVPASVQYVESDGNPVTVGDVTIQTLPLLHPNGSYSYRLEHGPRRIVLATDHEHGDDETDGKLVAFARDADCLIYDATYLPTEYEGMRKGWGHSTWYAAVQIAMLSGVKQLVLFHHHPDYSDEELEEVLQVAKSDFPNTAIASEGMELPL
jgi:phosphoribosyl 1,2-cyclic phosphodiesterase